jgi:predicted lipid-binding transport protein (Tim44 family)
LSKHIGILAVAALAVAALMLSDLADAKRLGGGRSLGAQRSITPQATAPASPSAGAPGAASNPVMPAQPGAGMAKSATPAAAAPAAKSGMSKWLGPIAGLAAGLGLAALLSHFGLSEGFASLLLMGLLVVGVVFLVRMFLARRGAPTQSPLRYAGAGDPGRAPGSFETPSPAAAAERVEPKLGAGATPPAPSISFAKPLPAGFDAEGFVRQAKLQFVRLQAAHDAGDRKALADVMTPALLSEVAKDLDTRGEQKPTEVQTINAEVLEVTTENGAYWASVRFTGTLREDGELFTKPFDEVWNLTKPVDGATGWLLAGIQQLEAA